MPPWPVTASRTAYENPWIRVVEDHVTRPDGSAGTYGVVELHHPAVFVVALTEALEVILVTLDRHTVGLSVEVPSGGSDGQEPRVAAARELREEAGLEAERWHQVASMWSLNGVCRAPAVVYLATGLTAVGSEEAGPEQEVEGITTVQSVPWATVVDMIRAGQVTDNESVAALMYAAAYLRLEL